MNLSRRFTRAVPPFKNYWRRIDQLKQELAGVRIEIKSLRSRLHTQAQGMEAAAEQHAQELQRAEGEKKAAEEARADYAAELYVLRSDHHRTVSLLGRMRDRRAAAERALVGEVPRILVDIRETETIRGYHALAVAELLARDGREWHWSCLTSGHADEMLARQSLGFDAGIAFETWDECPLPGAFDLYLLFADSMPEDAVTEAALTSSRMKLLALTFAADIPPLPGLIAVSGNDTAAVAASAQHLLGKKNVPSKSS